MSRFSQKRSPSLVEFVSETPLDFSSKNTRPYRSSVCPDFLSSSHPQVDWPSPLSPGLRVFLGRILFLSLFVNTFPGNNFCVSPILSAFAPQSLYTIRGLSFSIPLATACPPGWNKTILWIKVPLTLFRFPLALSA